MKKNMLYFYFLGILISFLASCKKDTASTVKETDPVLTSGIVTIIFQNPEMIIPTHLVPIVSCFNGYYNDWRMIEEDQISFDIEIYLPQTFVNYVHVNEYSYEYFVQPGDTLSIKIIDGLPFATSTNIKLKDMDLNAFAYFSATKLKNIKYKNNLTPVHLIIHRIPFSDDELLPEHLAIIKAKDIYIDSLAREDLISDNVLSLLKEKRDLEILRTKYSIHTKYTDSIMAWNFFDDDMLIFSNYQTLATAYTNRKYGVKYKYNPMKIYDDLLTDEQISQKTKLGQLYGLLTKIGAEAMTEDFEARADQFLQLANDSVWDNLLKKIAHTKRIDSKEMVLFDQKMKEVNFEDLMEKHRGKVIYIDLWASWCAPCIASFSAGEELRKDYHDP